MTDAFENYKAINNRILDFRILSQSKAIKNMWLNLLLIYEYQISYNFNVKFEFNKIIIQNLINKNQITIAIENFY